MTSTAPAQPTEQERAAAGAVLRMIWGLHVSRAVYAVAELGIADLLAGGPASRAGLAKETGADEASLYRVLRLLAAMGVFTEVSPGSFGLTVLGDRLRSDSPASMRSWARIHGTFGGCRPHEHFLDAVMTGKPGFITAYGMPLFEYLAQHPSDAAIFNGAMTDRTAAFAPSVAASYDFSGVGHVVDVGGGIGTLLAAILRAHGHLKGTLFELPEVAGAARPVLAAAGVADRCQIIGGDFFEGVTAGADCYLLANVLHDWDDATAVRILAKCQAAAVKGGRVVIAERLIPEDPTEAIPALLSDINMLVLSGGKERTNDEYRELLRAAGLQPGVILPVTFPYGIIEGLAA